MEDYGRLGLGYRAKYLYNAVRVIKNKGGEKFLQDLRKNKDYQNTKKELTAITGIG